MSSYDERPAGPAARGVLYVADTIVESWDGIATLGDAVGLVRLLRTRTGTVDVDHEIAVGGFDQPTGVWHDGATTVGGTVLAVHGGRAVTDGRWLRSTVTVGTQWTGVVVVLGASPPLEPGSLAQRLEALEEDERRFQAKAVLPRDLPQRAQDALDVLRACTFEPTGAVIASPTTSLPEAPGADRQFDYRYTWVRDAALAVSVAALLGERATAQSYLEFLHSLSAQSGVPAHPLATVRGDDVPEEHDVTGVAGWAGSLPIRVGNGAGGQLQYDALGMLVEAVSVFLQTGGRLHRQTWRMVRSVADQCCAPAEPSSGIWEFRTESMLTSADIGRWLALDRAIWIARGWRPTTRRRKWKRARDEARDMVLASLTPQGRLPQCYDGPPRPDAAALMVAVFGMLDRDDPRTHAIVDDVITSLGAGAFVYRYAPDASDGFAGREGAFIPVSWWAVSALANLGRVDEARARAEAMSAQLPRLQSEEIDPETGESLGNVPLVWSHMENARALYILDAAAKRERYGATGLWAWRLARFARLRFRG